MASGRPHKEVRLRSDRLKPRNPLFKNRNRIQASNTFIYCKIPKIIHMIRSEIPKARALPVDYLYTNAKGRNLSHSSGINRVCWAEASLPL